MILIIIHLILKFRFSEKATKIWRNLPLGFDIMWVKVKTQWGNFFQIMWPPHNILTLQVRLHLRRKNTLKKYEECHWGVIDKTTIVHFISNQFVARSHIFIKFIQIISVSGLILKSVKWMQGIGNGNQIRIKKRRWNFQGFVNSRLSRLQAETWANIINESSGVAC